MSKMCCVSDCDREVGRHGAKGMCSRHYKRKPKPEPCTIAACTKGQIKDGLCMSHWQRLRLTGELEKSPCSAKGCTKESHSHGWCNTHWMRWRRKGSVAEPYRRTPLERCLQFIAVDESTGCWNWTGKAVTGGYGAFSVTHKQTRTAPRWLYQQLRGAVPESLDLDHLCHNTRCVNPTHLEPVTRAENIRRRDAHKALHPATTHRG